MNNDTQTTPQAFKDMIVQKYPDGVSSTGQKYADMDPVALTQAVVGKFPNGMTNSGVKYSSYLPQLGQSQQDASGAAFPASPNDTSVQAGLKTLGNLVPSAINTGVGMVKSVVGTPSLLLNTLGAAADTGDVYNQAQKAHDAALKGAQDLVAAKKAKGLNTTLDEQAVREIQSTPVPDRGLETLKAVPGSILTVLEGILPFLKPALAGDISGTAQEFENNPVGNVLPIVAAAEGGANMADEYTGAADLNRATASARTSGASPAELQGVPKPAGVAPAIENAVSRTGQAVIKPVSAAAEFVKGKVGDSARFSTSAATGLNPDTITMVKNNRGAFTPEAMQNTSRLSVARQIESGLKGKLEDVSDSGKGYAPIRKMKAPVRVEPGFLNDLFNKNTGLTIQEAPVKPAAASEPGVIQMEAPPEVAKTPGKLVTSPAASIRDAGDISRLQKIYNTYQPLFEAGKMTPNEFLNLRSDLADAANFETKNGKSVPVAAAAARMRGQLNDAYRPQIPGLEDKDAEFWSTKTEAETLQKGLLDNEGNLTDSAINRIANATGRGKDLLLARLEEIVPGITKKIEIVKAIEDIKHTEGPKVGTYTRAGAGPLGAFALFTGHPYLAIGAIAEAIIASPKFAVPILRAVGATSEITAGVISKLKGYLNPELTASRSIPFMPRSQSQIPNPTPIK